MNIRIHVLALAALLPTLACVGGCGSDPEAASITTKPACIAEVTRRLLACGEDKSCEQGVTRYAGYCYNTAEGSQLDICRGGRYFFQQPLNELRESDPELMAQLTERQQDVIILTGQSYCMYNTN